MYIYLQLFGNERYLYKPFLTIKKVCGATVKKLKFLPNINKGLYYELKSLNRADFHWNNEKCI
jgi:hypothetical protein